jgi:hypothetical protein
MLGRQVDANHSYRYAAAVHSARRRAGVIHLLAELCQLESGLGDPISMAEPEVNLYTHGS